MPARPPAAPSLRSPRPVRASALGLLLALFGLFGGVSAQTTLPAGTDAAPTGLELLDATLWMQSSAERDALCRQTYALASQRLDEAFADPDWTAAVEQSGPVAHLAPAIIMDVDETLLDNHAYQARLVHDGRAFDSASWDAWCRERAATAVPGAAEFCREAHRLGVTVFYVTNRSAAVDEDTRANLHALGFPLRDGVDVIRAREGSSDKTARRAAIAADHRVLLLVGDAGGDFAADLHKGSADERRAAVERHAARWGREWIVLPNPMYGSWEATTFGYDHGLGAGDKRAARFDALQTLRPAKPAVVDVDAAARAGLAAGPMPAWSTPTSAALWLQTSRAADVQLRVWPEGDVAAARLLPARRTSADDDHIAVFELHELRPGTTYATELFLDGARVDRPWPVRLRTQPLWLYHGPSREEPHAPPALTLAMGSCAYVNDEPFDRPGSAYGGGLRIFDAIADARPDAMLWLGDNVYFRPGDWESEGAMRHRYAHTRAEPRLQRLLGSTHHYATWDDHDYGPNNSDRSFALRGEVRDVFADYWPAVGPLGDGEQGVYQQVVLGDVHLFLLDNRAFRSANEAADGPDKVMLGERQLQWLMDGLASSTATFKLVVDGGQMLNPIVNYEGFGQFPHEQQRLYQALERHAIEDVLFISGDRHHSELLRLPRDGRPDLVEFTCSPLTARAVTGDLDGDHPARVPGTLVTQRNFGLLRVTGPWSDRRLSVSTHDADGNMLWEHEVLRVKR